jgi:hypothetical protein
MTPDITLTAGIVAATLLLVGVPLLLGKAISLSDRIEGADVPFTEPHEAHVREAVAVGNDEPDPDFIARTRQMVVDELAQRRGVVSS